MESYWVEEGDEFILRDNPKIKGLAHIIDAMNFKVEWSHGITSAQTPRNYTNDIKYGWILIPGKRYNFKSLYLKLL